jgi:hypothetical protein
VARRRRSEKEEEEEDGTGDGHSGERHCPHRKGRGCLVFGYLV